MGHGEMLLMIQRGAFEERRLALKKVAFVLTFARHAGRRVEDVRIVIVGWRVVVAADEGGGVGAEEALARI
jgi:hypothetical protein